MKQTRAYIKSIAQREKSALALITLNQLAKNIPTKGTIPADAIDNMDYYTWGGENRS